jgi:hypothetical protein
MSYFLLPKNNNNINIKFTLHGNENLQTNILNYYTEAQKELVKIILQIIEDTTHTYDYDKMIKIINPYEYIYSCIPGTKLSVSKLKTKTLLFYDLIEINNMLDLFSFYKNKKLKMLNISPNYEDFNYYIETMKDSSHNIVSFYEIDTEKYKTLDNNFDFIFFEEESSNKDTNTFTHTLIKVLFIILKHQFNQGTTIIKINNIFDKQLIEILYLFSSLFEKVYIIKPNTNNIVTFEKYIICKNFIMNKNKIETFKDNIIELLFYLKNDKNKSISSIIDNIIPCYFINKIRDLNAILAHQQLEALDQLTIILKTKNKEEKLEFLKKNNIQKSIMWCEKFKIPYNRITDKTNIFLPIFNNVENNEIVDEIVDEIVNVDNVANLANVANVANNDEIEEIENMLLDNRDLSELY